jgi:hypothetical protein
MRNVSMRLFATMPREFVGIFTHKVGEMERNGEWRIQRERQDAPLEFNSRVRKLDFATTERPGKAGG